MLRCVSEGISQLAHRGENLLVCLCERARAAEDAGISC